MNLFNKTIFSIFGMALLATGFVACSSDDNSTVSTETTKTTSSFGGIKIMPGTFGFGMISPTIGDCMPGPGFCFSTGLPNTNPIDGIGRVDKTIIRLSMSMNTYHNNKTYFPNDTFEIGTDFSLTQEISKELGFETETIVLKQTANVIKTANETFYIDLNIRQK